MIPPVFSMDEVEGLEPKYMLYGFGFGLVGMMVPMYTVPNATSTIVKAWSDRAVDVYRMNLRENRPAVEQASVGSLTIFHQRGLSGAGLQQETGGVLGGFVTVESIAHGFRSGLRFLSLMMLAIGLVVAVSIAHAAKGLGHRLGRVTREAARCRCGSDRSSVHPSQCNRGPPESVGRFGRIDQSGGRSP